MESWMLPMLCAPAPGADVAAYDEAQWACEPKLDGWRLICHRDHDSVRVYGGRNGSSYTGQLPYLEAALMLALPADSCVDGEITAPAGWGGVQGAMTRGTANGAPPLTLWIFDVLRVGGTDTRSLPWTDRRRLVERIVLGEHMAITPILPTDPGSLAAVLAAGGEGVVLKRKSSRYVNSRSPSWVKVKPQQTAEARVTGFKPGQGSFAGLIGAIEFQMLDTGAASRCSGFDMTLRREITANPDAWVGQIIEIKHHGIGREGKPRHPQYLRRRDDRSPVSTQLSQIAPPRKNRNSSPKEPSMSKPVWMRNYGSMGAEKLQRCIAELDAGKGDAYDRCVQKGGDVAAHLAAARAAQQ